MSEPYSGGIVMPPPPGIPPAVPMAPLADDEVAYVGPPPAGSAPESASGDGFASDLDDHAFFDPEVPESGAAGGTPYTGAAETPPSGVRWPRVLSGLVVATLAGAVGWLAMEAPVSAPAGGAATQVVAAEAPAAPIPPAPPATPSPMDPALPVAASPPPTVSRSGASCVAQSSRERCIPGLPRVAPAWTPGDGLLLVVSDVPATVRIDGVDVGAVEGFVPVRLPEGTYAVEVVSGAQVARLDARVQAGALNRARFRFAR